MFLKNGDCSEEESPSAWQTGCDSQSPWTLSLQELSIFKHRHQGATEVQDVNGESVGIAQPRSDSWGDSIYVSTPNASRAASQEMRSWCRAPEKRYLGSLLFSWVPTTICRKAWVDYSMSLGFREECMDQCRASVLCLGRIMKALAFPRPRVLFIPVFCGLECWAQKCWRWSNMSPVPFIEKNIKEGVEDIHALENLQELQRLLHLGTKGPLGWLLWLVNGFDKHVNFEA